MQSSRQYGADTMRRQAGDRVRVRTVDDSGIPIIRYGTVQDTTVDDGPLVVVFDDSPIGDIVDVSEVEDVDVLSIELVLNGVDLSLDPDLRQGLAAMWRAEVDLAGVEILSMFPLGAGLRDSADTWALAEVNDSRGTYILRVHTHPNEPGTVRVRADLPSRWETV